MSSSVESRIVTMKFDNAAFNKAAESTLGVLGKLKGALAFTPEAKGFSLLQSAANKFSLSGLQSGIAGVSNSFLAMATVGITALSNITNRAVDAGISLAKSLTIDPLASGFAEYETGLNSVQTILSNTQASGATLEDVNATLLELNKYADQTIYNFAEMTKNIGTFTAAGVDLKTSAASIKGIANLAALSGSNSQQASTAMYQLSQAISSGRVSLQDWNSVVNAGMGGTVFQRALAQTAVAMGQLDESALKLEGSMKNVKINGESFRDSISAKPGEVSWLSKDVLTNTLEQFTGDLNKAELRAQGFNDAQIKAIQEQAKAAKSAATDVKSLTQLIDTLKEGVGSGWAQTWQLIFGDFKQAKHSFSRASAYFGDLVQQSSDARNRVLAAWQKKGGRMQLLWGIREGWAAIVSLIKPIHDAFRDVFPRTTGSQLKKLTVAFREFMQWLVIGDETGENIRKTFRGVFAIFSIVLKVVGGLARYFFDLFGIVADGSASLWSITGGIGEIIYQFDQWLERGDKIGKFFDAIIAARNVVLEPIIKVISAIIKAFGVLIQEGPKAFVMALIDMGPMFKNAFNAIVDGVSDLFNKIVSQLFKMEGPIASIRDWFAVAWSDTKEGFDLLLDSMGKFGDFLRRVFEPTIPIFEAIGDAVKSLGDVISGVFGSIGGGSASTEGLTGSSVAMEKTAGRLKIAWESVKMVFEGVVDAFKWVWDGISGIFGKITGAIKEFIGGLDSTDAANVINIGIFALIYKSFKNIEKIIGTVVDLKQGALDVLESITKSFDTLSSTMKTVQTSIRVDMIIKIAKAVLILALALLVLSLIDSEKLGDGLVAVSLLIALLVGAMMALTKALPDEGFGVNLIAAATAMGILAFALVVMAGAVALFSLFDHDTFMEGLARVGATLLVFGLTAALLSKASMGLPIVAFGLIILSAALTMLAGVVKIFSMMDGDDLAHGIFAILGLLTAIALPMAAMSPLLPLAAIGLILLSVALTALVGVLKLLSLMSGGDLFKSIGAMAAMLTIIAVTMLLMVSALPGAFALIIIAKALLILTGILAIFIALGVKKVAIGLLLLAAALIVVGGVSAGLGLLAPLILAFGASLLVLSLALIITGAAMFLFATGLGILAASGAAGFAALIAGLLAFGAALPVFIGQFGIALKALAKVIEEAIPELIGAFGMVIGAILTLLNEKGPQFIETMTNILLALLGAIQAISPKAAETVRVVIFAILDELGAHMKEFIDKGWKVASAFIDGIINKIPSYVNKVFNAIISFMNDLADTIKKRRTELFAAGWNLATTIIESAILGFGYMFGKIKDAIMSVFRGAVQWVADNLDVSAIKDKLLSAIPGPVKDLTGAVGDGLDALGDLLPKVSLGGSSKVPEPEDEPKNLPQLQPSNRTITPEDLGIDPNPVISPVIDLSEAQKESQKLKSLIESSSLTPYASLNRASIIDAERRAVRSETSSNEPRTKEITVNIEQNNTSPRALSPGDSYRNTKSAVALAKEALKTA